MTTFGDQVYQYGGVPVGGVFTTGTSFFVSSVTGSNGNSGKKPSQPFATLDYAVGQCTADKGDVIYCMPGHAETWTLADSADLDVAGITVIGLGNGSLRPTFTYTATAGEMAIGAANVTVKGLRFVPGISAVVTAIDVEATFSHATIEDCEFRAGAAGFEFNNSITVGTTATDFTYKNCHFSSGLEGAVYAISLATPTRARIIGNTIMGDYSTACVGTITGAGVMCEMRDNIMINGQPGALGIVAVFTQSAAGTWFVANNRVASDVATFILMFTNYTSSVNLGNLYTDDTTMAVTAVDRSASIPVSADA